MSTVSPDLCMNLPDTLQQACTEPLVAPRGLMAMRLGASLYIPATRPGFGGYR
jgi:hypothetical protein